MKSKIEKDDFVRLLKVPEKKSFFLFGPRGTGKSSWISKTFPNSHIFDLLESETYNRLLAHPQDLLSLVPKEKHNFHIVIDEVQRIPALLNEVHRLIENKKLIFVLSGSSARKLRRQGVNLLAGRALNISMFPLTALEMGKDFNLKDSLKFGMLPGRFKESSAIDFLHSYVSTYLREEVQQEGLTRNLSAFSRFLEAATFSQASPLVLSNVASDSNVERKTVEEYFSILDDLMIGVRIPIFAKRAKRELLKKSKFFFFDVGVFYALRPKGPLDDSSELSGPAMESLVFNELRAINSYDNLRYEIYFWRTKSKHEVDFVLYGEKGLIAIEVKASPRVRSNDLDGLKLFQSDYPMVKSYLIYTGTRDYYDSGVNILSADTFFSDPRSITTPSI